MRGVAEGRVREGITWKGCQITSLTSISMLYPDIAFHFCVFVAPPVCLG